MSAPLRCPTCSRELTKTTTSHGLFWSCAACGGNALGVDVLRRTFARDQINALWRRALTGEGSLGRACPSCSNAMIEVAATSEPQPRVDVCRLCSFVWFDTEELRSFTPLTPKESKKPELPQKAREAIAIAKVEALAREAEGPEFGTDAPDEFWKQLVALFGLPVERARQSLFPAHLRRQCGESSRLVALSVADRAGEFSR